MKQLESALAFFEMDNGTFPTTEEGLEALVAPPARLGASYRAGGYLQGGKVPLDSWGNTFHYQQPGIHNPASFDLWSLGADGQLGGECVDRDVGNWEGGEPDPCTTWADRLLPAALLGVAIGLLGLSLAVLRAVRTKSWRPLARGLPIAALIGLALLGAAIVVLLFRPIE